MNRSNSFVNGLKLWHLTKNNSTLSPFGSGSGSGSASVAVHKLRESKWFSRDEQKIFCAVVECGFIVEIRDGQENGESTWFGIVICKTTKDKKPLAENIEIYSIRMTATRIKVIKVMLADVWARGEQIRINNFSDKQKSAHSEKIIQKQLKFAIEAKQLLWHNSQHFTFWCRYGDTQQDIRKRQMSEVKWGSVGMNAGMMLLSNRPKSLSATK